MVGFVVGLVLGLGAGGFAVWKLRNKIDNVLAAFGL